MKDIHTQMAKVIGLFQRTKYVLGPPNVMCNEVMTKFLDKSFKRKNLEIFY